MERIMEGLHIDVDLRPRESAADWIHSVQFGGITYLAKGGWGGHIITEGERALDIEDLGPELYRVAFRIDGYGGHPHQDGDATYLNPGTPVYQVKGYTPEFRLAALEDGRSGSSKRTPTCRPGLTMTCWTSETRSLSWISSARRTEARFSALSKTNGT